METKKITPAMLMRLPRYLTYLKSLPEDGPMSVSASTMAKDLGLGDVLVRKDLSAVSGGGRRKVGHLRHTLIRDIENFLGCGDIINAVLIGNDRLGQALLADQNFEVYGTRILAGFDPEGESPTECDGKPVLPMAQLQSFCDRHRVRMGVITVAPDSAQNACNRLIDCGIEVIWNFAPAPLQVPSHVLVQNVDLAASLAALRMQQLQQREATQS